MNGRDMTTICSSSSSSSTITVSNDVTEREVSVGLYNCLTR